MDTAQALTLMMSAVLGGMLGGKIGMEVYKWWAERNNKKLAGGDNSEMCDKDKDSDDEYGSDALDDDTLVDEKVPTEPAEKVLQDD